MSKEEFLIIKRNHRILIICNLSAIFTFFILSMYFTIGNPFGIVPMMFLGASVTCCGLGIVIDMKFKKKKELFKID